LQQQQQQKTPTLAHPPYQSEANLSGTAAYGPRTASQSTTPVKNVGAQISPGAVGDKLAEIPTGLFYPFYPENLMGSIINNSQALGSNEGGNMSNENAGDYTQLLAAAAAQPNGSDGTYGCQPSQDSYMLEEILPASIPANGHTGAIWMNVQRSMQY